MQINELLIKILKSPYYFNHIHHEQQKLILQLLPKHYFTTKTLDHFYDVKINVQLFNNYFGHVPLYRLYDLHFKPLTKYNIKNQSYTLSCNNITWNPKEFIDYTNWINAVYIEQVRLPNDKHALIEISQFYTIYAKTFDVISHIDLLSRLALNNSMNE